MRLFGLLYTCSGLSYSDLSLLALEEEAVRGVAGPEDYSSARAGPSFAELGAQMLARRPERAGLLDLGSESDPDLAPSEAAAPATAPAVDANAVNVSSSYDGASSDYGSVSSSYDGSSDYAYVSSSYDVSSDDAPHAPWRPVAALKNWTALVAFDFDCTLTTVHLWKTFNGVQGSSAGAAGGPRVVWRSSDQYAKAFGAWLEALAALEAAASADDLAEDAIGAACVAFCTKDFAKEGSGLWTVELEAVFSRECSRVAAEFVANPSQTTFKIELDAGKTGGGSPYQVSFALRPPVAGALPATRTLDQLAAAMPLPCEEAGMHKLAAELVEPAVLASYFLGSNLPTGTSAEWAGRMRGLGAFLDVDLPKTFKQAGSIKYAVITAGYRSVVRTFLQRTGAFHAALPEAFGESGEDHQIIGLMGSANVAAGMQAAYNAATGAARTNEEVKLLRLGGLVAPTVARAPVELGDQQASGSTHPRLPHPAALRADLTFLVDDGVARHVKDYGIPVRAQGARVAMLHEVTLPYENGGLRRAAQYDQIAHAIAAVTVDACSVQGRQHEMTCDCGEYQNDGLDAKECPEA